MPAAARRIGLVVPDVPAEDVATLNVFQNPAYAGRLALPVVAPGAWAVAQGLGDDLLHRLLADVTDPRERVAHGMA